MSSVPWKTTDDLIAMIERKIAAPTSQNTFSNQDYIDFLNEEMIISQVPSILQYHEEYYVAYKRIQLQFSVTRYAIPDRAFAMRIRDVKFEDTSGNLYDMTQIPADDKAYFQRSIGMNEPVQKFYIEGNDIVLTPTFTQNPTGFIRVYFYIRPNQLVENVNAAIISNFQKQLTITNNSNIIPQSSSVVIAGIVFNPTLTPIANTDFLIGVDASTTATNLTNTINAYFPTAIITAAAVGPLITVTEYDQVLLMAVNNNNCYNLTTYTTLNFTGPTPVSIQTGLVDLLQYLPGHTIRAWDLKPVSVGGNYIQFDDSVFIQNRTVGIIQYLQVFAGDYICPQNQCIIPYLPPDLHIGLVERTCARILAANGDAAGLAAQNAKIQELDQRQNQIIADRAESTPIRMNSRKSILRYTKMGTRRQV